MNLRTKFTVDAFAEVSDHISINKTVETNMKYSFKYSKVNDSPSIIVEAITHKNENTIMLIDKPKKSTFSFDVLLKNAATTKAKNETVNAVLAIFMRISNVDKTIIKHKTNSHKTNKSIFPVFFTLCK